MTSPAFTGIIFSKLASQPRKSQQIYMKVSAIVPAYNESERIEEVLKPLTRAAKLDQIIVVDDGSTDDTAERIAKYNVELISLPENQGKAAALDSGVKLARNETLLFMDADLVGLKSSHIDRMIQAYEESGVDMLLGVFKSGRLNTDLAQSIAPYLSGQRILTKKIWDRVKKKEKMDFGVEMALTKLSRKENLWEDKIELSGVTHVMKEEKRGFSQGVLDRLKMYLDIVKSVFTKV